MLYIRGFVLYRAIILSVAIVSYIAVVLFVAFALYNTGLRVCVCYYIYALLSYL